ncbi:beta-lactamase family protein [Pseudomaricurvus alkylphenolicus]|uniref:serine hydrolase domain-containing protein n=1 Tax=Pseudomaricurvus alkylphenolicus TaxID=1306991 RepID=UPI00141F9A40|nr:serine hydrolase domain-containing protein [Pseudomaricurvus alkylphenolicus]NIB38472.1 beta-lactamase family protein [Pseudomaricurvus alkylphenolicus]
MMRIRLGCSNLILQMNKAALLSLPLIVLQLGACSGVSVKADAEVPGLDPSLTAQLQRILDAARTDESSRYPGVIFRLQSPTGSWNGVSGVANIVTNSVIDPGAKFRCGSVIKPFIATVILQLVEENLLSLKDRLSELLEPEITAFFEHRDSITVRMLLNHTSGIGEWTEEIDEEMLRGIFSGKIFSDKELFAKAAKAGTRFKPGESYRYNNTEFNLLGLIIESKTGISWRDNIRQRILNRLALRNTLLPEPGNRKMPNNFISGYMSFNGQLLDTSEFDPSMAGAAGGHALVSNAEDLSVFIEALLDGLFFKQPTTLDTMLTFVDTVEPEILGRNAYGLGIGRYLLPNGSYAYGHTGGTAGYQSFVVHFPKEDITAASVISIEQGTDSLFAYLVPSFDLLMENQQIPWKAD